MKLYRRLKQLTAKAFAPEVWQYSDPGYIDERALLTGERVARQLMVYAQEETASGVDLRTKLRRTHAIVEQLHIVFR